MQRTLSLPIYVNCLLLIYEIKKIARETQCFILATRPKVDLILPLLKKKSVKARTLDFRIASTARSPVDQAVIVLSLVHTVPVYAPVRPGSLQPADRGEPGRTGTEFDCVHIFPTVLRTRPG